MERKPHRRTANSDGARDQDEGSGRRRAVYLTAIVASSALAAFLLLHGVMRSPEMRRDIAEGRDGRVAERRMRRDPASPRRLDRGDRLPRRRVEDDRMGESGSPASDGVGEGGKESKVDIAAGEYIAALRESGETAGFAAFPPPGSRPPRSGVVVPPDYGLPEGFARHYQTTDDGRRLDPILVVAPGYEIVDEAGDPVDLMDDRVVPPEYAPSDLPVQMLDVPTEPGSGEEEH